VFSYFLAAGASEPFGYPVTKQFRKKLSTELRGKFTTNPNSLISEERILLSILEHDTHIDIEYILEFLKQLTKINHSYPVVVNYLKSYGFGTTIPHLTIGDLGVTLNNYLDYNNYLIDLTTRKIYEYYEWREENIEKAQRIYSRLFHINDQNNKDIFTTNYDTIIEEYCKESTERELNLVDGFVYDPKSGNHNWISSNFDEKNDSQNNNLYLFKLHGSLNWKRRRKYGVVKLEAVERKMEHEGQYTEDLLIKPTLSPKEEEQEEPFKTLFDKFRERIVKSKICIVVGYSFRDQGINEIFDMFMKQGGRLIIISPDATKEFEENFIEKYHPIQEGYTLLDDKVTVDGINGLVAKIKSHLS
jgi:hypothetical protein